MSSPPDPPKKRLGQHFLKDPNTARIVAAGVTEGDVVLEVGPGRGFLTAVLARRAQLVHAVELDPDVLPALREAVRDLDNVASPLVLRLLEEGRSLASLHFMVQLEVARRMAASRGTKDYATYAVLVQLLAEVRIEHKVSPNVFDPPPRVYSAVVSMERRRSNLKPDEYRGVKKLVLAAFRSRRKQLVNNLPEQVREEPPRVLNSLGYGPDARAEELSPEDFVALYRAVGRAF